MGLSGVPKYEDHFTAFVDLLGFSEISIGADESSRLTVLDFLVSLASLRGEFSIESTAEEGSTTTSMRPAISTFSDHIVVSYPLEQISARAGSDEGRTALTVFHSFNRLLAQVASAALSIGFLIRGGATIGKLYHSGSVVFGEALIEAYQIESRTAVYPRVVLSSKIYGRENWMKSGPGALRKGADGLYYFDYFSSLVFSSAQPGENWHKNITAWFERAVGTIANNLKNLETTGKLAELSKWAWFAHEFRSALERIPEETRQALGLQLDAIPWKS